MPEREPTFESSTAAQSTQTVERNAPVTDEELANLDPSVLADMSKIEGVLNGETTVDDAFGAEAAHSADAMAEAAPADGDTDVINSSPTPPPAAAVPVAAPTPTTAANPPAPTPATPAIPSAPDASVPVNSAPVFVVGSVDDSHGQYERAHEAGTERLTAELNDGGRWRRFLNGIWKGNQARQYYEAKYTQEALGQAARVSDTTRLAMIERLASEADETIHAEAGERRAELANDSEFATKTKELIKSYVENGLSDEALAEERGRMLQELADSGNTELLGDGRLRLDNIIEIAQAVKGATEQGTSLERVLEGMKFVTAEARTGARTEVHYNAVERAANKLASTRIGALVGPMTVITALGILTTATKVGSHSIVGAAVKTIAPGAAGAVWAGLRENRVVKDERAQHAREMAYGGVVEAGSKRRAEMEATRYETATAHQLTEDLRSLVGEGVDLSQQTAVEAALASLAAVEARMQMGDRERRDLISYSSRDDVETERLDLDLARAEVRQALEAHLTDDMRTQLGLGDGQSVHDLIAERGRRAVEVLSEDVSAKDKAFNHLRARRVAKAAATGLLVGVAAGAIAQEVTAAFDPMRAGLVEQLWHAKTGISSNGEHQTLLEGIVHGEHSTIHHVASASMGPEQHIGAHGALAVSSDETIVHNPNGTISFMDPNGHEVVSNLPVGPDGQLTPADIHELQNHGFTVNDLSHSVTEVQTSTVAQSLSAEDFVHQNGNLTTHIQRDFWYDNNTSGVYDHNELGLHWGGSGVNPDGSYQMSVASMTSNGSFHDGLSTNWAQDASAGKLELAISATKGTQTEVFMVPVSPDGSIHIAADSPAAHFFSNENGHAVFNGKYAEVVQNVKTDANGVEHVRPLATLVGHDNVGTIHETITTQTPVEHMEYSYNIVSPGYDTVQDNFTEMAPNIPIVSRRPLEALSRRELSYYYRGDEVLYGEEARIRRQETSPRLLENPDADLQPGQELKWYHDLLVKKRGRSYVKQLEDAIESTPELRNISTEVKAIVQIPVNAAGSAEANGIYRLLTEAYGKQDSDSLKQTIILLHVNWFDQYPEGGAKTPAEIQANIEKTRAEIGRAMADNPQLRLAVINTEWHRDELQSDAAGRAEASSRMYDVSLLALNRATQVGLRSDNDEAILIRNDADAKGVSVNYLRSFVNEVDANDRADIITGTTSFDSTKASRLPGMVFASSFMQGLSMLAAVRGRSVHTGEANFGVKASSLAAVGGIGIQKDNSSGAVSYDVRVGRRVKSARDGILATRRRGRIGQSGSRRLSSSSRRIAKRVTGRIDTDSGVQEEAYVRGIPMVEAWNSEFDSSNNAPTRESLRDNGDAVIERIRHDMEGAINGMGTTRGIIDTALAWSFPRLGTDAYHLTRDAHGFHLEFTDAGINYLKNHLTRDSRGRDGYGVRKIRQLYGRARAEARRQPTHQELFGV